MRTFNASLCFVLVVCTLLPASMSRGDELAVLRAGVAKVDITPKKPVKMAGYASRQGLSTGVHDPLSARVLAFECGDKRLVLVSTDLIGFYGGTAEFLREAILREFDLEPAELFLSAIHTHAGPSLTLDKEKGHPHNLEYTLALKDTLIEAIRAARKSLEAVTIGTGVGHCPVGGNRRQLRITAKGDSSIVLGRNPDGITDKEVLVMKVARADGAPLVVAFDYATHGTSLGGKNYTVSGDVIGLAEQFVEKIFGPETTAPAFAGASGNIDPWFRVLPAFNTEPGWVPEPVLLGTFLGEEVVHVCRGIAGASSATDLNCGFATLELPPKPSEEDSAGDNPDPVPFNVTVARLGDIAFVGLGGEVLTEIGLAIKAGSPCAHTFVITHCNGAAGYLAPKELHVEGGYEIRSTHFAPQAAEVVVRRALAMLHGL